MKSSLNKVFASVGSLKLISLGLGFLTSMVVARWLGPENYGHYVFLTSVMSVMALPLYGGMPALLVREIVKIRIEKNWALLHGLKKRVSQAIILGSSIIFILLISFFIVDAEFGTKSADYLLLVAFPLAPLMALNGTRSAMLRGFNKIFYSQVPDQIIKPFAHLSVLSFLAFTGLMTVTWALTSLIFATLTAFIFGSLVLKTQMESVPTVALKKYETLVWLKSLMPFTAIAAIYTINNQAAILFLGWLSEPSEVGFFRIADRMGQIIVLALTVANIISGPQIAKFAKMKNYCGIEKTARHSVRLALAIASPVIIIYYFFGEALIKLAFGSEYEGSVWILLMIIAVGQFVNVFFGSVGNVLNMTGNERFSLVGMILGLVTNVVLAVILIPKYHAIGAALACSAGIIVWNITLAVFVKRQLNIRTLAF
ncbi:flippase [Alcanivorax sp. IL3]|uniref:flippase n=1 Tax=unclassified Alcanivorax TaxID=2638842 RepID=UPI0039C00FBD